MTCSLAEDGGRLPRRVRIRFAPFTGRSARRLRPGAGVHRRLRRAVQRAVRRSFRCARRPSAERLPLDLNGTRAPISADPGDLPRLFGRGAPCRPARPRRSRCDDDDGTYVLFGRAEPVVTDAMATIIDPELPRLDPREPARATRRPFSPATPTRSARRRAPKPTLLVSWAGPTPRPDQHGRQRPARARSS